MKLSYQKGGTAEIINNLGGVQLIANTTDGITGYKVNGADTVFPFSSGEIVLQGVYSNGAATDAESIAIFNKSNIYSSDLLSFASGTYSVKKDCNITFVMASSGAWVNASYNYTNYLNLYINDSKVKSAFGIAANMGESVIYTAKLKAGDSFKFTRSGYSWARNAEYQHAVVTAFS